MARDMSAFEFLRQRIFRLGMGVCWLQDRGGFGALGCVERWHRVWNGLRRGLKTGLNYLCFKCYILDYIAGCELVARNEGEGIHDV